MAALVLLVQVNSIRLSRQAGTYQDDGLDQAKNSTPPSTEASTVIALRERPRHEDEFETSPSILKLSHQQDKTTKATKATGKQQKQSGTKATARPEAWETSQASDLLRPKKSGGQQEQRAKKNKLMSFVGQSRTKLSSLLPTRATQSGAKPAPTVAPNSTELPMGFEESLADLPSMFADPFLSAGLPSQHMIPYPPKSLGGMMFAGQMLPHQQHPAGPPPLLLGQPYASAAFQQQQQQRHNQMAHYGQAFGPQAGANQFGTPARPANPNELFVANQSTERLYKIRLDKQQARQLESLPMILASSYQGGQPGPHSANSAGGGGQKNNDNASLILQAAAQLSSERQRLAQSAPAQTGATGQPNQMASVAASALSSAAAATLLTERAKSLFTQLNQQAQANKTAAELANVRHNREANPPAPSSSAGVNQNQLNLANMIKSAAEAWASNSVGPPIPVQAQQQQMVRAGAGGGLQTAGQAIVLEHDGPTITTLDFNGVQRPTPVDDGAGDGDDDGEEEDVASFYSEQAEQEGSNNARRRVRPNNFFATGQQNQQRPLGGRPQKQADFGQAHGSGRRQPLRGRHQFEAPPAVEQQASYAGQLGPQRHREAPTASEFFNEQNGSGDDNEQELAGYNRHNWGANSTGGSRRPTGSYPDSINAIKEQGNSGGGGGEGGRPPSSLSAATRNTDESTGSRQDPIESLIRDLQELHRKRKSEAARDLDDSDQRARGLMKSSSDDYEDIMSGGGGGGQRDEQHRQLDQFDQEDEQTRLLRKKLLARLRAKHERKKHGSADSSSASFGNDSIRIPLHALLLAALDRRMSSSESRSQSVGQDESLLVDERNRAALLEGRRDFNEATADLGSLFEGSSLFERLARGRHLDDSLRPLNLQNISNEPLTPAGLLLFENLAASDQANRNGSWPGQEEQQQQQQDQLMSTTTRLSSTTTSTTAPPVASPATISTTFAPTSSSSTGAPLLDERRSRPSYRDDRQPASRWAPEAEGGGGSSSKGRRAVRDEGDFDVDQQVDEYASDQHDRSLEPSWMQGTAKGRRSRLHRGPNAVDFDDEFDEIDRQTRNKLARSQQRRKSVPARRRANNGEAKYAASEQRFFNRLKKDTAADINDVDQTIRDIESSIPDDPKGPSQKGRSRSRQEGDEADGYGDPDEQEGARRQRAPAPEVDESGPPDYEGDDESNETPTRRGRPARRMAEPQENSAVWKANMVDAELRKMEGEAEAAQGRRRERQQRDRSADDEASVADEDDGQQRDGDEGEREAEGEAESRLRQTRTTVPPVPDQQPAAFSLLLVEPAGSDLMGTGRVQNASQVEAGLNWAH